MSQPGNAGFELLTQRPIIDILIGDTKFGREGELELSMPYLSGPTLAGLCNQFGMPTSYDSRSRWMYLDDLIPHCIDADSIQNLLSHLFAKQQFSKKLAGLPSPDVERLYSIVVQKALDAINGQLYFGGNGMSIIHNRFVIRNIGEGSLDVNTPKLNIVNRDYIRDIAARAAEDVENGHYDSAVTKSRTLLEEVFCYAIEMKGSKRTGKEDITVLYGVVKKLYNMHENKDTDKRINSLVSGLGKVVQAITELRNKNSDAHGYGLDRIAIRDYHAQLVVNSALTVGEFILGVVENANNTAS